jgi:mRNA-degrading endonuclease RelE of RelBE toxin-antitoxin system
LASASLPKVRVLAGFDHGPNRPLGRWVIEQRAVDILRHWRTLSSVEFIETPTFTRLIAGLMDDTEYSKLQLALVQRPDWGRVIPGGGGLRKLRWAGSGRGKRGGLRVIYYWQTTDDQVWLLLVYRKNEREDLSRDEIKQLKQLVEAFEL